MSGMRCGLAGGEDVAVRGLGEGGVFLELEDVVDVAEGFLLGHDHDVERRGEGDELAGFVAGEGAAGRCGEGVGGVLEVALEVGRVEIDLVRGEDFELMLLEGERGEGAAGEVVVLAAILHGGPVADGGGPDAGGWWWRVR